MVKKIILWLRHFAHMFDFLKGPLNMVGYRNRLVLLIQVF